MPDLLTTFGNLQRSRPGAERRRAARTVAAAEVPTNVVAALREMQLLAPGDLPRITLIPSGLGTRASRVDVGWGTLFLKRALATDSAPEAFPAERTCAESAWFKIASGVAPGAAPAVLGALPAAGMLALEYLHPEEFPTWQSRLAAGRVEPWTAAELGHLVGRLHAASANSPSVNERFAAREPFRALALAPLLVGAAAALPGSAATLQALAERLAVARIALVHGALLPENVLIGPRGPLLTDADCAHSGDPMFDVASCLGALALRMATHTQARVALLNGYDAFHRSYFAHVTWEMPEAAEARAAALLPVFVAAGLGGLAHAGDAAEAQRRLDATRMLLETPAARLDLVARTWLDALSHA